MRSGLRNRAALISLRDRPLKPTGGGHTHTAPPPPPSFVLTKNKGGLAKDLGGEGGMGLGVAVGFAGGGNRPPPAHGGGLGSGWGGPSWSCVSPPTPWGHPGHQRSFFWGGGG